MKRVVVVVLCVSAGLACSRERELGGSTRIGAPSPVGARSSDAGRAPDAGGSAHQGKPLLVRDATRVPSLVGELVTLVGVQTRTKQPSVLGVDVDGDHGLADELVQVTGILRRTIVERDPNEGAAPGEMVATRGPGTYYSIVDPVTGTLAKPVSVK